MLEDIRSGRIRPDYVFVFKLSRFGRNAADTLASLQFLEDFGVNLLCVEDGIDSAGAAGKLLIAVYAAVAEAERENINVQTMAGRWQKAKNGGWNGGFAPYGYKLKEGHLIIADDEAELIREIFHLYTENPIGMNGVARRLNERGLKKKIRNNANTDRITSSFVKAVLDNPVYAGYLAFGRRRTEKIDGTRNEFHVVKQDEYEKFEGKHEAIISKELWEAACEKRGKTGYANQKTHSMEHSHILSGILKCPVCGAPMYGNVNRKKKKDGSFYPDIWYYVCKNRIKVGGMPCNFKKRIRQDSINAEVLAIVREYFNLDKVNEHVAKQFLASQFDIDALNNQLQELVDCKRGIEEKKTKLLSKIMELDADDPLYDSLYDDYNGVIREFLLQISDLDSQIQDIRLKIETNGARKASVDKLKELISGMWDRLDEIPNEHVKEVLNNLIKEIHILESPEIIKGQEYWIKRIRFQVPYRQGTPEEYDTLEFNHISSPNEEHVETVCLLSNRKPDTKVRIDVDLEDYYRIKDTKKNQN